ncbi:MMPL family transporter [Metasolibacillus meyeri]|uniref:MMPL family transporter n=1 Tax=Metasolibacillus meyeri TaxID=1071052 RepID=A0AAW9NH53_9BACL|nr:MMPL family transporter [Metasolibacillus meyeri]MEC1177964.1 MMPL family transporter [Metasolibacillus meyeri]
MQKFSIFVTKYAKAIVSIWIVFFLVMGYFALQLPSKLQGDGFFVKDDHSKTMQELSETFDLPAKTIFVLFENKTDDEITAALNKLEQVKSIQEIISPIGIEQLQNGDFSYALLHFGNNVADYFPVVDEIREILSYDQNISITGEPAISKDINVASQKDLMQAEAIGLPIALIVLLLAFGTVVASLLPVIIGAATVIVSFGVLTLLSGTFDLSIFILNIVPMLGLALSIDFALLFINRYREERHTKSIEQAVQIAIQTAGRSIIFSALCVMIGLGAMVVIKVEIFQNIALGGSIVVFLAIVSGLTLLPATIMLLGDRLNKWRILRVTQKATKWQAFAAFVMRRPLLIIVVALALLGAAIIPVKDMDLTIPSKESLPTSYESRATFDKMERAFDFGADAVVYLLAERSNGWDNEDGLTKMLDIQQQLQQEALVKKVDSLFTTAQIDAVEIWQAASVDPQLQAVQAHFIQENKTYMAVYLDANGSSTEAQDFVREWKDKDLGVPFTLAGAPKFNQEIFDEIASKIGLALIIIMITTFIILMIAFRSILIPVKAIIMNVIGLASTFGLIVYIFQYGHLGIEAGTVVLIMPVIVFCLVFGLSMDYEVFLISRIQEEYLKGADNTTATVDGLVSTSKIITSAALIMIVITGAFAFTDVMPVKQIGVGIAIAIAIDATVIRLMLVPSLMKLFGDWNWWLPFAKKK